MGVVVVVVLLVVVFPHGAPDVDNFEVVELLDEPAERVVEVLDVVVEAEVVLEAEVVVEAELVLELEVVPEPEGPNPHGPVLM